MSKTVDDLQRDFRKAFIEAKGSTLSAERAGIAAVVRALRPKLVLWFHAIDQNVTEKTAAKFADDFINEILGDAGSEKVAGGPTREDGRTTDAAVSLYAAADGPPAPATSLPKCVWTKLPKFGFSISCTDKWLMNSNYGGDTCPECGRLIEYKFTEAQR